MGSVVMAPQRAAKALWGVTWVGLFGLDAAAATSQIALIARLIGSLPVHCEDGVGRLVRRCVCHSLEAVDLLEATGECGSAIPV